MAPPKKGDLSAEESELLQAVSKGNVQEACRLLGVKTVRINCLDEHGMTPLMHAAYKGRAELCELLLRHGANVNCNEHEHGYTALMFAGLSGNKEITRMMLEAGAKTDAVNSVGRTAAQMAAFVGQHDCVTIINNFFSRESLDCYTRPQGLETEARLPATLAAPLHRVILTTNLNPVKVVLMVSEGPLCSEEALGASARVLERVCESCMQQQDMNEVLAVKIHYLGAIFSRCLAHLRDGARAGSGGAGGGLDGLLKSLLKGRQQDGFPLQQEKFVRECVRKFPFPQATLLQQLVRSIAPVEIGREPTALSILTQAVTGQVGLVDAEFCTTCGEKGADKKCSACKMVVYCGQPCQKLHWFTHKKSCRHLAEEWRQQEARAASERHKFGKQQQQLDSAAAGASEANGDGGLEASASVPGDPAQAPPRTPTEQAPGEDPKGGDSAARESVTSQSVEE